MSDSSPDTKARSRLQPPLLFFFHSCYTEVRCKREYKHKPTPKPPGWTVYLSPRAVCAFVCFSFYMTQKKKKRKKRHLWERPADFPLRRPRPDQKGTKLSHFLPPAAHRSRAGCTQLFVLGGARMCPLSVGSHPEPTAINAPFVRALRPPLLPTSWRRQS